ncbi:hypothetical protein PGT21_032485 [Puccinia graminis f. sp. tritici]|uniref:Uncharacterized protein n=1 Tax=Puccinia graminis f. sp. tritici TaxID=56615 RepID=A0A5B0LPU7_PUCGR|nr:hypothetical protein PGT21_032485 [Puccinia graminis f. sp. tritici]
MSRSISVLAVSLTLLIGNIYGQVAITFMYSQTNGLTCKGFGTMQGLWYDGWSPTRHHYVRISICLSIGLPLSKSNQSFFSRPPALLHTSIIKDSETQSGTASPCQRTIMSGKLEMKNSLNRAEDGGLPDVGQNGMYSIKQAIEAISLGFLND